MRPDELVAHLEAYANTLSVVHTLRLCNRFGTGSECHVNKLPIELVGTIEGFILEPARQEPLRTSSKLLRCWKSECHEIRDHFDQEELYKMYHRIYGSGSSGVHPYDHDLCDDDCPAEIFDAEQDEQVIYEIHESGEVDEYDWGKITTRLRRSGNPRSRPCNLDATETPTKYICASKTTLASTCGSRMYTTRREPCVITGGFRYE